MTLLDYFQPLNFFNLLVYFALFLSWFVVGTWIDKKFIKLPSALLLTRWTFGLAIWTLAVYVGHLFYPLKPTTVLDLYLPIFLFCFYKTKISRIKLNISFKQILPDVVVLLLPLVIIAKPIFTKLSLPPYMWDEMAYHWQSPSTITFEKSWNLSGGLYSSMPRSLETAALGLFVLTKTYASARLLQFLIFLTAAATVYFCLKENIGTLSAAGGYIGILFFSPDILTLSTSGYVDVAAAAFIILALLTFFYKNSLAGRVGFIALAVGMKYSVLSSAISIFLISLLVDFKAVRRNTLISCLVIFSLFGGYWYIKNAVLYKNPVYPLIFACKTCPKKTDIFGSWTTPITLSNLSKIKSLLFNQFLSIEKLLLISLILLLIHRNRKSVKFTLLLTSILALDWTISSKFTAFEPRYFIHWQLMTILFVAASWNLSKIHFFPKALALLLMVYSASFIYRNSINTLNTVKLAYTQNPRELAYAKGMINIYDWTRAFFPRLGGVIKWCEEVNPDTQIRVTDPELIWGNYDALFSIFMTNCSHSRDELSTYSKAKPLYAISLSECDKNLPVDDSDGKYYFRKNNNDVICKSRKIKPYLYEFTGFSK